MDFSQNLDEWKSLQLFGSYLENDYRGSKQQLLVCRIIKIYHLIYTVFTHSQLSKLLILALGIYKPRFTGDSEVTSKIYCF